MAQEKIIHKSIINSDKFTDMPFSAQALYFQLLVQSEDNGYVNITKRWLDAYGFMENDLFCLLENEYILKFGGNYYISKVAKQLKESYRRTRAYKDWKNAVLKRDNYRCQKCNSTTKLCVHHIVRYRDCYDNPDLLYDINNGICLCYRCHKLEHNNGDFRNG